MRICVGTLYSGEREYDRCCASIRRQTHTAADHFVIRDLPNREAHQALYRGFEQRSKSNDLFVKIDADMVLRRDEFFADLVAWFGEHPGIDELEIAVQDFFTDRLIFGLHVFRRGVEWPSQDETLFVDRSPVHPSRRHLDSDHLAPAADHCPDPSPIQAFHYGVHKALKVLQPGCEEFSRGFARFHWENLAEVRKHHQRNPDPRLAQVMLGAELTFAGRLGVGHVNYEDPGLGALSEHWASVADHRVSKEIARLRRRTWGWLPSDVRREFLCSRHPSRSWGKTLIEGARILRTMARDRLR
jgi:hypothetical protein